MGTDVNVDDDDWIMCGEPDCEQRLLWTGNRWEICPLHDPRDLVYAEIRTPSGWWTRPMTRVKAWQWVANMLRIDKRALEGRIRVKTPDDYPVSITFQDRETRPLFDEWCDANLGPAAPAPGAK